MSEKEIRCPMPGVNSNRQQDNPSGMCRLRLTIAGQVQGVGFRPFVWRLARDGNLSGFTRNTPAGVQVEAQGACADVEEFKRSLAANPPPLARITSLECETIPVLSGESGFVIMESSGAGASKILVSPDVAICPDCQREIRDPDDRRHGYAFANCVNCGPRYTITRDLPYDRARTTMACFPLCEDCAREYADPADRRFHAQPIACPKCGPSLWFVQNGDIFRDVPLKMAAAAIRKGQIVAIKGLGGFQLVCDATNSCAVRRLRQRKRRPAKALAIMTANLESAGKIATLDPVHEELLESAQKPIVLCPKKEDAPICAEISPDSTQLGIMLPYTPLHELLLNEPEIPPYLVMTSGNPQSEPICLGNREALARLDALADAWLLHDRDILTRVDDSVVAIQPEEGAQNASPLFMRRARGYAPAPLAVPALRGAPVVLGMGAEQKTTFCLARGDEAFVSQHIGDLKNPATLSFYEEALGRLETLLDCEPALLVRDMHPDFLTSRLAMDMARLKSLPVIALQHHAAHAAAVLGENGCLEPALALCLDGTGLGEDGAIWGCELIEMDLAAGEWKRMGSLKPFPLPGGDLATLEPWRIASALLWQQGLPGIGRKEEKIIFKMLEKNLNAPSCSSCGRLFDAVAALLGLCDTITYEGQAAMRLEKAAWDWLALNSERTLPDFDPEAFLDGGEVSGHALFGEVFRGLAGGRDKGELAALFHWFLAQALAILAARQCGKSRVGKVGLSGGCLQNRLFGKWLRFFLRKANLAPLTHVALPPGDGCISYGQAVWGRQVFRKKLQEAHKVF